MAGPSSLQALKKTYGARRIDNVRRRVARLAVETPSWGFRRGGTRFGTFASGEEPDTIEERIAAAGRFYRITGKGRAVALHFPWDGTTEADLERVEKAVRKARLRAGAINVNLFAPRPKGPLDHRLRFGSLINPSAQVRRASLAHVDQCIKIMRRFKSRVLTVWVPDGTNSPGQMSFYDMADRLEKSLKRIVAKLRGKEVLLLEYKPFEPSYYATAVQDWGWALALCRKLGPRAKVLVDLGHHLLGTNIEQIVALLGREGKLGGFHFNDKKYADDDLASGSLDPAQLFRIFCVLVEADLRGIQRLDDLALMIDQSHCVKDPLAELVESVENIEIAYAKALLVDYDEVRRLQNACDPSGADRELRSAFLTDVRPLLPPLKKDK